MNRPQKLAVVAFVYALATGSPTAATETVTDANVVTGLDFSHSVTLEEHWIVQEGLADALQSPEILRAIQAGPHGRIGFAAFGWHIRSIPLVPWMLIASADDSKLAAERIRSAIIEQIAVEARLRKLEKRFGRPTDLSQAIISASGMLATAPYRSTRSIMNIVGNGPDNVNEDTEAARDMAVRFGFTVNGLVLGNDPHVVGYFTDKVVGGPNSFVMHVPDAQVVTAVLKQKLLNDIVVGLAGRSTSFQERVLASPSGIGRRSSRTISDCDRAGLGPSSCR
jgi:Ca-activated chloride channel homolog